MGTYSGAAVNFGTLLARAGDAGILKLRYPHLANDDSFRTGRCRSWPEVLPDGRIRVHEWWQWTEGAEGHGISTVEELSES